MPLKRDRVIHKIQEFDLKAIFINDLGWNLYKARALQVTLDDQTYSLIPLAEKGGMGVYTCTTPHQTDYATRRKLEREVVKAVHEHLIIFMDTAQTTQVWQWVRRENGKPDGCREHKYHRSQSGEALFQKLQELVVSLEEEENATIVLVRGKAKKAFDVETITKKFYERFQKEHAAFLKYIQNIPIETASRSEREWYASLMLNRLMFIYFIQKKGFLDGDTDYLRHRLQKLQHSQGSGKFHGFYRQFLLRLFHEGLGQQARSPELTTLLGKVPYLNGGLFDLHDLERNNPDIQIPDEAFERIFTFFDAYNWHLDERPLRADNEINPDVLGYIFEKYINQKQMGAYYTKEDITEYISKNTIIPFLFDKAGVEADNVTAWQLLRDNPKRYIYSALQHGSEKELPLEIAAGLTEISMRTDWNKAAPSDYALPTEIWREVVARRKRYEEVFGKLVVGEITAINDLITYNLNIRQFAQDVLENCSDPIFLWSFYQVIAQVKVLDPTCGSGAFLFAVLNLLEPLYDACLERMQVFLDEAEKSKGIAKYKSFEELLRLVDLHPNRRYFILKTIIIQNLYGVDIMAEAVEIAKLRLFLKLVAQIEKVEQVEPLPDIDFNIRPGNTLVGFATFEEAKAAIDRKFDFDGAKARIEQKAQEVDRSFTVFRNFQTQHAVGEDKASVALAIVQEKQKLRTQIAVLQAELDRYLAGEYGIDPLHLTKKTEYEAALKAWRTSHQPFHWFVEFYGIMAQGGFDVIIGNPPYVEYSKVKKEYTLQGYKTESCGNIYAFVIERSLSLLVNAGTFGMIVPLSLVATERMYSLQKLIIESQRSAWLSLYDVYPSKIFDGAKQRLTIALASGKTSPYKLFSTKYKRWGPEARPHLLQNLSYWWSYHDQNLSVIPKLYNQVTEIILNKLRQKEPVPYSNSGPKISFYVHRIPYNYVKAFDFTPYFWNEVDGEKKSEDYKPYYLKNHNDERVVLAVLNSNLFFWWWYTLFEGYHCGRHEIYAFPVGLDEMSISHRTLLSGLADQLMSDVLQNKNRKNCQYKNTGKVIYDEFYPRLSKPIIDEIDRVLAEHYGFTEEELDFIINYDIKYRMGRDSGEEVEA
ncbi:MAG: DNA methyltransferase [Chloroflexota bacterium]